jgi:hypothetical protein
MMIEMRNFFIFFVSIFLMSLSAQEVVKVATPDDVFRDYAAAFFDQDLEKLKSLTFFADELEVLVQIPKVSKDQLLDIKKRLQETPIKWYTVGEVIKINGAPITVNDVMVNESKMLGTIRMLEMVYPIILRKSRTSEEWKVDPTFMIQSVKKHLKIENKRNQRDFRIELDGELFYLNEGERIVAKDNKGVEHRIVLFKNEIQHYKDGRLRFHYHKDMDVYPNKMVGGFVYSLSSDLGPEIHLMVYDKGASLASTKDKYINMWIENYKANDAVFEENALKPVRQEINGQMIDGSVMYVRSEGKVLYNQFYFFEENGAVIGVFAKCSNIDTGILNQYLKIACEDLHIQEKVKR